MKFIYDDGGRIAADLPGHHASFIPPGDCAARAMAIALEWDYIRCCSLIDEFSNQLVTEGFFPEIAKCDSQWGVRFYTINCLLGFAGYAFKPCHLSGPRRVSELPNLGTFITWHNRHMSVILDGAQHDLSDRTRMRLYGYWIAIREVPYSLDQYMKGLTDEYE